MTVRLRYAPSPTGHLHIGGARTALFNYLYAKRHGGTFILRIEDTDIGRNVAEAAEEFAENLRWLGVTWDEGWGVGGPHGPYSCMERLPIYTQYVQELRDKGLAYECFCSEEELAGDAEKQAQAGEMPHYVGRCRHLTEEQKVGFREQGRAPTVRLRVPVGQTVNFHDMIRGELHFDSDSTGGDFRIVKSNGIPVYNFAVVVDDHLMAITHVVRGEEHISNTPRQLFLYTAFGWAPPQFGHLSLILGADGRKLSKRDESIIQFIEQYKAFGYLPEAVFNFLALLGWSPGGEQELLSHDEIIAQFGFDRVSKSGAFFDAVKLAWTNGQYIKQCSPEELLPLLDPFLEPLADVAPWSRNREWRRDLLALYQDQLTSLSELPIVAATLLQARVAPSDEAMACLQTPVAATVLEALERALEQHKMADFTAETVKLALQMTQQLSGVKGKDLFMSVRAATTGQLHGRDLNRTLALLGYDRVCERVQQSLVFIRDTV